MLPVLLLVSAVAPLAVRGQFAQTSATCSTDFAWMANSKGASPCQAASSVDSLCNNGNWNIPQLNSSVKYNNPQLVDGTASLCTCSWASYNLISACIACQGFPEQIPFWGDYSSACSGKISESYWPSTIALPSNIVIPFWAATNPTTWTNQKFTTSDAKTIAQQDHPDVAATPSPSATPKKSAPVGAIAGGVVGGVLVIGAFAAVALFMVRRQKKKEKAKDAAALQNNRPPHMRNISDMSVSSNLKSVGGWTTSTAPLLTQSSPYPPTSPTIHTHTPSVASLPVFANVVRSTVNQSPSPPPASSSTQPWRPEDVVTPFTLPPTTTSSHPDQKRSQGEWPVFDQPNAPPASGVRMEITPFQSTPQRNRFNPPAYSESSPGDSSTPPRHRAGQESTDSHYSSPSSSNIYVSGQPRSTHHTPANSGSSIAQMGVTPMSPMSAYATEIASPLSQGRSLPGTSTDYKRRPSLEDDEPSIA